MMNKICAIVVTYNRKILLKQSLQALLDQTVTDFDILVVDNASTDNTREYIDDLLQEERIDYVNTGANLGGSGG
ncbi:glycosyltransferase, partial [Limosilactobacillus fermentum]